MILILLSLSLRFHFVFIFIFITFHDITADIFSPCHFALPLILPLAYFQRQRH
jgi:hypothetical protein